MVKVKECGCTVRPIKLILKISRSPYTFRVDVGWTHEPYPFMKGDRCHSLTGHVQSPSQADLLEMRGAAPTTFHDHHGRIPRSLIHYFTPTLSMRCFLGIGGYNQFLQCLRVVRIGKNLCIYVILVSPTRFYMFGWHQRRQIKI